MDFEALRLRLTRENALELLADVACPYCQTRGQFSLFDEINNNGVGIRCDECGQHHPFVKQRIVWVPKYEQRRRPPNDIVAVVRECGNYCYFCGEEFPELLALGIGASVHHTRPFAKYGDRFPKIPVCTECHELANFMQRLRERQARVRS